jgi:hypothetical protein
LVAAEVAGSAGAEQLFRIGGHADTHRAGGLK